MADFDRELLQHYVAAGLHDGKRATAVADACKCAALCWAGEPDERRPARGHKNSEAYRPWIGRDYEATRMIVVGENLYDHGGWTAAQDLVKLAIEALGRGERRMNFGDVSYKGTLFYSRAAEYARRWLEALGHVLPVEQVFDHIAFTNHVKCSPRSDKTHGRSRPNDVMWSKCGRHVLAEELRILGARRVLLVGTSWNAGAFRAHVWPKLASPRQAGAVEVWREPDGREVLVVPHPASFGGAARSIADEVSRAVGA